MITNDNFKEPLAGAFSLSAMSAIDQTEQVKNYILEQNGHALKELLTKMSEDELKDLFAYKYDNGDSCLHLAIQKPTILRMLAGKVPSSMIDEAYGPNADGNTVLHLAASSPLGLFLPKFIFEFYKSSPESLYKRNHEGNTPLHIYMKNVQDADKIDELLKLMDLPSDKLNELIKPNAKGETIFHLAKDREKDVLNKYYHLPTVKKLIIQSYAEPMIAKWHKKNPHPSELQRNPSELHIKWLNENIDIALTALKGGNFATYCHKEEWFRVHLVPMKGSPSTPTLKILKFSRHLGRGSYGDITLWKKMHSEGFTVLKRARDRVLNKVIEREARNLNEIKNYQEIDKCYRRGAKHFQYVDSQQGKIAEFETHFFPNGDLSKPSNSAPEKPHFCYKPSMLEILKLDPIKLKSKIFELAIQLKFLHDKNIVHLDIKGDNISIDEKGRFILRDMGGGRLEEVKRSCGGTPLFSLNNDSMKILSESDDKIPELQKKRDLYALGLVFFQMATGQSEDHLEVFIRQNATVVAKPKAYVKISDDQRENFLQQIREKLQAAAADEELIQLILGMLEPNIFNRMTSEQMHHVVESISSKT